MSESNYPRGKLVQEDEGGVQMRIAVLPDKKTLVIDFGKPVVWLGLGKAEVLALIEGLKRRADEMIDAPRADME